MDIVTGMFTNVDEAMQTVRGWMDAGVDADHIGVVTRNRDMGAMMARDLGGEYSGPTGEHFTGRGRVYDDLPGGYVETIRRSNLPDEAVDWYRHHLDQGHILVITDTGDNTDLMHRAARIVHEHNGLLYDEDRGRGTTGMTTTGPAMAGTGTTTGTTGGTTGKERTTDEKLHAGTLMGDEGRRGKEMGKRPETEMRTGEMETHVPIVEEQVVLEKTQHQVGELRVTPEVSEERVDMPTTVTHQEIRVERRRLDNPMHPTDYKGMRTEGGEIRIPIIEEEIRVTKTPMVREELIITRLPVSEQQTIHETVRREDVRVEKTGDVNVEGLTEEERRKRRPAA